MDNDNYKKVILMITITMIMITLTVIIMILMILILVIIMKRFGHRGRDLPHCIYQTEKFLQVKSFS